MNHFHRIRQLCSRSLNLLAIFCFVGLPSVYGQNQSDPEVRGIIKSSCLKCHGKNDKTEGDVNLLAFTETSHGEPDAELLESLIEVLDSRTMPPESEPDLGEADRNSAIQEFRKLLHSQLKSDRQLPQTPMRRMNRFQYNNAIQDLFQLKPVVFSLPERMLRDYKYFNPNTGKMPDNLKAGSRPLGKSQMIEPRLAGVGPFPQDLRAEHGFDNRADHLSLSPLLLESFLKLSRSIVESSDFNPKTCGIWADLFDEPKFEKVDGTARDSLLEAEIRKRLRIFLTKAFRRPVTDELLERYSQHAISQIHSGQSFETAMKMVASAAIASPRFLYIYDQSNLQNQSQRIDEFELATRLSFFLWGSIPDEELLRLAAENKLSRSETLGLQVDRMLSDPKLKRFCDSFPAQWLQLDRIISSVPDRKLHPKFYFAKFRVSMHMMLEPLLLFETILIEDRSIMELIDSDFSYRSELLSAWYKDGSQRKATPTAIPFKRVPLTDRRQGGVITNAAVMTMTSNPTRTQPITRGAWIASVIFNNPPAPPPADVPPLPEAETDEEDLTIRERFADHRKSPACAGCHTKIDPLGFALENFGPTGRWRDRYENGRDVDSSGTLFRQYPFDDIVEFKDAILSEKDRFARAFAKHLLSFALAREVSPSDSLTLDQIVKTTKADDYKIKTMLKQIVLSESFLQKHNPPEAATNDTKTNHEESIRHP